MNTDYPGLSSPATLPLPAASADPFDLASHEAWFERYFEYEKRLCTERDPWPMELKNRHTQYVLENARQIASREQFPAQLARAAGLAALYHDISRFEQYRIWGTFRDRESCDHGDLSAHILRQTGVLACEGPLADMAVTAVASHNKFDLPDGLAGDQLTVCKAVRDADRIDILRVLDEHLSHTPYSPTVVIGLPDDPQLHSDAVIEAALHHRAGRYEELRSVNDFRLLVGSWIFIASFDTTRRMIARAGHAHHLIEALPPEGAYATVRTMLLGILDELADA